jgi:hypothetical protein
MLCALMLRCSHNRPRLLDGLQYLLQIGLW